MARSTFTRSTDLPTGASDDELVAWGKSLLAPAALTAATAPAPMRAMPAARNDDARMSLDEVLSEIADRAREATARAVAQQRRANTRLQARLRSLGDDDEAPVRDRPLRVARAAHS